MRHAALYMRLSVADGDLDGIKAESNSISHQREMLRRFAEEDGGIDAALAREYVDDGCTGSNFDRPGFQAMMDDARAGRVSCIVVKDLSRFGREYAEAGSYIEQVLPFLRVRFVSLMEGIDSDAADNDRVMPEIALRNIVNAHYSHDLSLRIATTQRHLWSKGKFIHGCAPYGWLKDPEDKHGIVIDPDASKVVRRIFDMALSGMDSLQIRDALEAEGVPCPGEYFRSKGMNGLDKKGAFSCGGWRSVGVGKIISNPMAKGTLVLHKTERLVMGRDMARTTDDSERYVFEGAVPAVVTPEEWDRAQAAVRRQAPQKRRPRGLPPRHALVGLVKPACGHSMSYRQRKDGTGYYFALCKCDPDRWQIDEDIVVEAACGALRPAAKSKDVRALLAALESGDASCNGELKKYLRHVEVDRDGNAVAIPAGRLQALLDAEETL